MNLVKTIARLFRAVPYAGGIYWKIRYRIKLLRARRVFREPERLVDAMSTNGAGTQLLTTHSGIEIEIRRNIWDAVIVEEVFVDKCYDKFKRLPSRPVVIDVGGYIGDFSLYAAKVLDAEKVIVVEPMRENLDLLRRNVERNDLGRRIVVVPAAVSDHDGELKIFVKAGESGDIHASSHLYHQCERRVVSCISLHSLMKQNGIRAVDLLKIDCEGAEYDIVLGTPEACFRDIKNIVMEITPIENYESRLNLSMNKFRSLGYETKIRDSLVFCSRPGLKNATPMSN